MCFDASMHVINPLEQELSELFRLDHGLLCVGHDGVH